ncbi:PTS system, cellobiose-specific IIC component [Lacticaseibacillus paracasei subsp. tolerans Lpl7]|uniref:Permease IIC component n=2 Tax=Lacticaseibacillus paracasei TaxID=1597 RepID=A0A829GY07_LACPA|nr:PTS transporter subunit EIIC [Lacticaseibacillus paracasei]EPC55584.1 PTS system cellobiose-specific transporter subunit IIC [Lacticaseibacillus paracasei subsp. paracasei CNCM I-4270]EPC14177.1 PTS system, cellobiose-specific IIC component [Lacticaseibacillus paracasei subsp. tolerans Lpl7]EPC65625.1 PTS system cellobiose-specific transporter subunit IIC [Lacticaseibacillus paracasei subsp. tolerans Lpl14]MDO5967138.1 PTS transporter subunit EIIC [Lacticaseibacillus paracasei]MDS0816465.1 
MKFNVDKLQEPLLKASMWVQNNTILQAVKNAFVRTIPFTVIGSFSNLIKMQLDALIKSQNLYWGWLTSISNLFGYLGVATLGIVGLIVVISSAYSYAVELKQRDENKSMNIIIATLLAFSAYFVMVPNNVNFADPKAKVIEGFASSLFSYEGMFTGLIVGMLAVALFAAFSHSKFTIKMPGSVPQNVFDSFFALIPMAEVLLLFGLARIGLQAMGYASLIQLIATVVIKPLLTVGTGLPAIIVVILLEQILWFLGLHGFNIVWGIVSAFWLPLFLQNVAKFAETKSFADISIAPNTMTNVYAMIGGSGATFGLIIAMLIFAKKGEKEREVAKLALVPGCFGINEPVIFGLPIVLNPIMFIPWIVVPLFNAIVAYVVTSIGWVVPLVVLNSGNEPIFFSTWILGGLHMSPVILALVLVIFDVFLYAPFVIMNQRNERQMAAA